MKNISLILLIVLGFSINSFSQTETINLSKERIGHVYCYYQKSIDHDKSDTSYLVRLVYQNKRQLSMADTEVISIKNQNEVELLIKDLEMALPKLCSKTNLTWQRSAYAISLYDSSNALYLFENPEIGQSYTILNRKGVKKLISWLSTIEIGLEKV